VISLLSIWITASRAEVSGWSNGGYSADPANPDYGTHDWIAEHALDWLPLEEKQWLLDNKVSYLYGTELPDNSQASDGVGDTTKHHVYYFANGSVQDDAGSQSSYGLRELVEVDEELWNDGECTSRAKALLASLKDSAEQLTVRSTVVDYGATPLLPGDTVHVALPNEGVDGDFRILSVEYIVDAKTQTLENLLELGREQPLLADYMFSLKRKTDSLSRYKLARV
jgi:hypothetical protein